MNILTGTFHPFLRSDCHFRPNHFNPNLVKCLSRRREAAIDALTNCSNRVVKLEAPMSKLGRQCLQALLGQHNGCEKCAVGVGKWLR
nr:hypothetical protein Iba_scaffold813225CG0010 [Ipomoea batatas]